jgi:hypothetical protein
MSKKLWKVRCSSKRKTGDGDNMGRDPTSPKIPERWGNPSTYWYVDAEVLAETKDEAIQKISESDYPIEPIENLKVVKVNSVID